MKKIYILLATLAIAASSISAQTATTPSTGTPASAPATATTAVTTAPVQNTEIYLATWLEYGYSNSQARKTIANAQNKAQNFGTFTLGSPDGDFVRVGIRETILPNLKAQAEMDVATMYLKQMNIAYVPIDGLTIKAGRMFKLFAQVDGAIYGGLWQGVSGVYDFGKGYVGLGIGNQLDEQYNTYYAFNLNNGVNLVGATYAQQPYMKFQPAVGFRPLNEKDLKLEIGANGEFGVARSGILTSSITAGGTSKDGTTIIGTLQTLKPFTASVDAYVKFYAYGFNASGEITYANLEQKNKSLNDAYADGYDVWQRPTFYGKVSYAVGKATPTVYYVWDDYYTKNDSTLNIEVPYTIVQGLVLNPVFSYALSGYNYNDGVYNANSATHDWTFGLRLAYNFSAKF